MCRNIVAKNLKFLKMVRFRYLQWNPFSPSLSLSPLLWHYRPCWALASLNFSSHSWNPFNMLFYTTKIGQPMLSGSICSLAISKKLCFLIMFKLTYKCSGHGSRQPSKVATAQCVKYCFLLTSLCSVITLLYHLLSLQV